VVLFDGAGRLVRALYRGRLFPGDSTTRERTGTAQWTRQTPRPWNRFRAHHRGRVGPEAL